MFTNIYEDEWSYPPSLIESDEPEQEIESDEIAFEEDANQILEAINVKSLYTFMLPMDVKKLIAAFTIGFVHSFSPIYCHPNIRIISNRNKQILMQTQDGYSRRIYCNQVMRTGVHWIEFGMHRITRDVSIGVSNLNVNTRRFVGFDENSYSLACGGKLQHNSDSDFDDPYAATWKCTPFKTYDRIGMELDLYKYTLTYFKNGKCLGKAFDIERTGNFNKGFVFAVSMAVGRDEFE